jgi:hypothetical protein
MQNHHRLTGRFADRGEAQPQLGHDFASVELEVLGKPAAQFRGWVIWRHRTEGQSRQKQSNQFFIRCGKF